MSPTLSYIRSNVISSPIHNHIQASPPAPVKVMCLFRIDPSHAPINPPGAAPVLVPLEEDQALKTMAGNEATAKAIPDSVDAREKLEPVRPVSQESLQERRESLANGTRRVEI